MESFTVVKRITEDYTLLLKEDGSLSVFFGAMTGVEIEVGRKIFLFKPVSLDGNWLIYSKHCRAGTLSDEADNVLEEDISFMERKIRDHQDGCEDSARKRTFSSMRMSGQPLYIYIIKVWGFKSSQYSPRGCIKVRDIEGNPGVIFNSLPLRLHENMWYKVTGLQVDVSSNGDHPSLKTSKETKFLLASDFKADCSLATSVLNGQVVFYLPPRYQEVCPVHRVELPCKFPCEASRTDSHHQYNANILVDIGTGDKEKEFVIGSSAIHGEDASDRAKLKDETGLDDLMGKYLKIQFDEHNGKNYVVHIREI